MEQSELLHYVVGALERLGIRYFVTGSTASIFFGEPRFTNDIDVVVDLDRGDVPRFCAEFPMEEFYLSEEAVERAVERKGIFNILHPSSALKVDVIIPADTMFNRSRFARIQRVRPDVAFEAAFSSAEAGQQKEPRGKPEAPRDVKAIQLPPADRRSTPPAECPARR